MNLFKMDHYLFRTKYLFYHKNLFYCLRILWSLLGVTAIPWLLHRPELTIPLTLGTVAAALTDLDDRFTGRLKNLLLILICFFVATTSIELLMPYPFLFISGLFVSTVGFIMLGALGERYGTIAFGSLLIAIYTMLGNGMYPNWYTQPFLLLSGAIWYNIIALLGHSLLPIQPIQEKISLCLTELSQYLTAKSAFFDPDEEDGFSSKTMVMIKANCRLVDCLNQTRQTLVTRQKNHTNSKKIEQLLHYYFVIQNIHEQISAIHFSYADLSRHYRYNDVLFRFHRLLLQQAAVCQQLADAIKYQQVYQHNVPAFTHAFSHLNNTLDQLALSEKTNPASLMALRSIWLNLRNVDHQLKTFLTGPEKITSSFANQLINDEANTMADGWQRVCSQLTPMSPLFRHAIRMASVLSIGYIFIKFLQLEHGYWILLTSLFVCQANYQATKNRLILRIVGTFLGILLGIPILYFIPSLEGQLLLIVISGLFFFIFRTARYALATLFITLLALLCFNLLGEGYQMILPRIIDTIIGCFIAYAAVQFMMPEWQSKQLPIASIKLSNAFCHYLNAIKKHYYYGRDTHLCYRSARREAHNCLIALAQLIDQLTRVPKRQYYQQKLSLHFLVMSQELLGYLSTLAIHRTRWRQKDYFILLSQTINAICLALNDNKVNQLEHCRHHLQQSKRKWRQETQEIDNESLLIFQQLELVLTLLPEFILFHSYIIHDACYEEVMVKRYLSNNRLFHAI